MVSRWLKKNFVFIPITPYMFKKSVCNVHDTADVVLWLHAPPWFLRIKKATAEPDGTSTGSVGLCCGFPIKEKSLFLVGKATTKAEQAITGPVMALPWLPQ